MELLLTDNELYNLIDCGIQGVHYDVDEDGYYTSLQGDAITYPRESLWLTSYYVNEDAKIYTEGDVAGMTYIEEKLAPIAVECYWQNFPMMRPAIQNMRQLALPYIPSIGARCLPVS